MSNELCILWTNMYNFRKKTTSPLPSSPEPESNIHYYLVDSAIVLILLERIRRLHIQREVRPRREGLIDVVRYVGLRVRVAEISEYVRLDVVDKDEINHVGQLSVLGEAA